MFSNLFGECFYFVFVRRIFIAYGLSHYSVSPYTTNAHINIVRMTWHIRCLLISHLGMHTQYNDNNNFCICIHTCFTHTHTQNNNNTSYVNKCLMRQNTDRVEKIEAGPGRLECLEEPYWSIHHGRQPDSSILDCVPHCGAARKPNKKCT